MYSWVGCSPHKGIWPRDKGAEIWPMLHLHSCVSWHWAASTWRKECLFLILREAFMHSWQPLFSLAKLSRVKINFCSVRCRKKRLPPQARCGIVGMEGRIPRSEADLALDLRLSQNSFQTISLSVN